MDNSVEGVNGGVSVLKWALQVLQSATRYAASKVRMVGMVGMVLNLFHPALWNCSHRGAGRKSILMTDF